ncbi:class I SAM-dependent methyltransferase [Hymenobacter sp. PAMC 26628]|uniref:class I SAM-dependent methyltransferase n=1 Tax=Hymenobacter sp. PAMC 26628 TaxID=1484118 RepID=UPI00076FE18A|nr:methyltransferase domain-containing protein [Hymenobacter sp. PAMC 26628]AMJ66468.1 methyltransferase type 11 [Hymenobacter sp. PAMC 26628]
METQLEDIRQQQRESWNKFSAGWKKWDDLMMEFMKPVGDAIIERLHLRNDDHVLDVASGTGEPGLAIAAQLKGGKVVSVDIAERMLAVASETAARRGLHNFETALADAGELPFADATFDAISCRFGFMFFPDMQRAAHEMVRVLKPGGRVATAVWNGPDKNFWVTAVMGVVNQNMQLPPPPPGAPGMFRCAQSGLVADLFRQAGLKNVSEIEVNSQLNSGTAEVYWTVMTEVAAPFAAALSKADAAMRDKIKREVLALVKQKYPAGNVAIASSALVICGEK